jgi:hypothetical protein
MDTSAVADTGPSTPAGFVRTQATAINARTNEERPITLAPATMFGTADFPPLQATVATSSGKTTRPNSSGNDNIILTDGEQGNEEDKDDEMEDDLNTSYGDRSTMSASTAGQSVVTFSQVAQRQAFDVSEEADAILHHSDCEEEDMQYHTTSAFAKLELKRKKAKKQSSLAVALIHAELDKRTAESASGASIGRTPIRPPERDSRGRIITPFTAKPPPATADTRRSSLRRAEIAGSIQTEATTRMMQQMELQMKALAVENARLAGLVATLMESNPRPNEQIEQICANPLTTSTEIVERSHRMTDVDRRRRRCS